MEVLRGKRLPHVSQLIYEEAGIPVSLALAEWCGQMPILAEWRGQKWVISVTMTSGTKVTARHGQKTSRAEIIS